MLSTSKNKKDIHNLIKIDSGTKFNHLTVLEKDNSKNKGNTYYLCKCDCGNVVSVNSWMLRNNKTKSCGCLRKKQSARFQDLTGQKFGKLTVLSKAQNKNNRTKWLCKCECGNVKEIDAQYLKKGITKTCGKCRISKKRKDLTGQKFGRLTVLNISTERKESNKGILLYDCLCECGNKIIVNGYSLRSGRSKSCGCYRRDLFLDTSLLNKKINRLKVIGFSTKNNRPYLECQCDCGNKTLVRKKEFLSGGIKSCGCLKEEQLYHIGDIFGKLKLIDIMQQDNKRIFKCQCDCGNILDFDSSYFVKKYSCGCCSITASKGEERIKDYLKSKSIKFQYQFQYNDLKLKRKLRFDFAIRDKENKNLFLIEFDGEQHFNNKSDHFFNDTYEERHLKDQLKNEYCQKKNIPLLRISYKDFNNIESILDNYIMSNFNFLLE